MSKREMITATIAIEVTGILTLIVTGDATAFVLLTAFACAPWCVKFIEKKMKEKTKKKERKWKRKST